MRGCPPAARRPLPTRLPGSPGASVPLDAAAVTGHPIPEQGLHSTAGEPGSLVGAAPIHTVGASDDPGGPVDTSSILTRLSRFVTRESTGGILLLAAAAIALILANSPLQGFYAELSALRVGPAALHLDLPLSVWAADGLLAVFFFVVGVELKHELFAGSLRQPKEAAVPVFAAVGGMVVPAALFVVMLFGLGDPGALHGWAIPTATDIAFALAVLAIFGRGLPRALRTFLLTLAVVDDLLAIIVIAAFYTASIHPLSLFA
ncbi:MAG: Na+/H+ antiporter NhaA, partial [Propionibacteriaceae bacterium]|nr:Na+/H+ antiporter NhaA [Propionibacteriaceae bacterium]